MTGRFPLLAHEHSLKLKPHRHTSYPGLLFALLITSVLLLGSSLAVQGAVQNPQSGSVGLTGTVPGPPPSQAAVILSPGNGNHTTTSPITVRGTCPANTVVFIEKNDVLGGQAVCEGGLYSVLVDLFNGSNVLVSKVVDGLGQYGPDSTPITVFYDPVETVINPISSGRQLFVTSDATVVAGQPGTSLTRTVSIVGGNAPYAVSWDWGDGETSLATITLEGKVSSSHSYTSPGTYRVIVRISDAVGNAAFIQLITVVNGPVAAVTSGSGGKGALPGALVAAWPMLGFAAFMTGAFWLGEHRMMKHQRRLPLVPGGITP